MKDLFRLLSDAGIASNKRYSSISVTGIAYDSRQVRPGTLFVAIRGFEVDGHRYISSAVEAGAAAVIGEEIREERGIPYIRVEDSRAALAALSASFYDFPAEHLKLAAVTGTNGKTSTALFCEYLLKKSGISTGVMGTVQYKIGGKIIDAERTTPESADIQKFLAEMKERGDRAAVMEASSHGLALRRLEKLFFDVAAFTNLSPEHLDFHKNMEDYYRTKKTLFTEHLKKQGKIVINIDDGYGKRLAGELTDEGLTVTTLGENYESDWKIKDIKSQIGKLRYRLESEEGSYLLTVPLTGRFNVYNSAMALLIAVQLYPQKTSNFVSFMETLPQVPGRLEQVGEKVFIDYAHTPDALEKSLLALRYPKYSLTVVFGAGGNRDRGKRPEMGKTAEKYADKIILTNDNPRDEDPLSIISEIASGISDFGNVIIEPDRREAIRLALKNKAENEIILIAGKGHEEYQEIKGEKTIFSDRNIAKEFAEARV